MNALNGIVVKILSAPTPIAAILLLHSQFVNLLGSIFGRRAELGHVGNQIRRTLVAVDLVLERVAIHPVVLTEQFHL